MIIVSSTCESATADMLTTYMNFSGTISIILNIVRVFLLSFIDSLYAEYNEIEHRQLSFVFIITYLFIDYNLILEGLQF